MQMTEPSVFVGLLWPGDSVWLHALSYPEEPRVANKAGQLIAPFIENNLSAAASISFASHSLGARVVLELSLIHIWGGSPHSHPFVKPSFSNHAKLSRILETFRIGTRRWASIATY